MLPFDHPDGLADSGRRYVKPLRGAAEAAAFRHGEEGADQVERRWLHGVPLEEGTIMNQRLMADEPASHFFHE